MPSSGEGNAVRWGARLRSDTRRPGGENGRTDHGGDRRARRRGGCAPPRALAGAARLGTRARARGPGASDAVRPGGSRRDGGGAPGARADRGGAAPGSGGGPTPRTRSRGLEVGGESGGGLSPRRDRRRGARARDLADPVGARAARSGGSLARRRDGTARHAPGRRPRPRCPPGCPLAPAPRPGGRGLQRLQPHGRRSGGGAAGAGRRATRRARGRGANGRPNGLRDVQLDRPLPPGDRRTPAGAAARARNLRYRCDPDPYGAGSPRRPAPAAGRGDRCGPRGRR